MEIKNPGTPQPARKRRGNPMFVKGNKGGPGRPKGSKNVLTKILRCANFMDKEGWTLLEEIARVKGSKLQLGALQTIAAYGFGKPTESVEFEGSIAGAKSIAEFLTSAETGGSQ